MIDLTVLWRWGKGHWPSPLEGLNEGPRSALDRFHLPLVYQPRLTVIDFIALCATVVSLILLLRHQASSRKCDSTWLGLDLTFQFDPKMLTRSASAHRHLGLLWRRPSGVRTQQPGDS